MVADAHGRLIAGPAEACAHGIRALRESGLPALLAGAGYVFADLGYRGTGYFTPRSKPVGGQLTDQQREYNERIKRSRQSPQRSTTGPARHSAGGHPPKHSTNTYNCSDKPVLRRPVESAEFGGVCRRLGVVQNMGQVGSVLDNVVAESFNSVLKVDFVHRHAFATRAEACLRIATRISDFYNTRRRHSKVGGLPPIEFEGVMRDARNANHAHYGRQEAAIAA